MNHLCSRNTNPFFMQVVSRVRTGRWFGQSRLDYRFNLKGTTAGFQAVRKRAAARLVEAPSRDIVGLDTTNRRKDLRTGVVKDTQGVYERIGVRDAVPTADQVKPSHWAMPLTVTFPA